MPVILALNLLQLITIVSHFIMQSPESKLLDFSNLHSKPAGLVTMIKRESIKKSVAFNSNWFIISTTH